MPWWGYTLTSVGAGIVLGYWGWLGVSVVRLSRQYAGLAVRVLERERNAGERGAWLQALDNKLDTVAEDTQYIRGVLKERSDRRGGSG